MIFPIALPFWPTWCTLTMFGSPPPTWTKPGGPNNLKGHYLQGALVMSDQPHCQTLPQAAAAPTKSCMQQNLDSKTSRQQDWGTYCLHQAVPRRLSQGGRTFAASQGMSAHLPFKNSLVPGNHSVPNHCTDCLSVGKAMDWQWNAVASVMNGPTGEENFGLDLHGPLAMQLGRRVAAPTAVPAARDKGHKAGYGPSRATPGEEALLTSTGLHSRQGTLGAASAVHASAAGRRQGQAGRGECARHLPWRDYHSSPTPTMTLNGVK